MSGHRDVHNFPATIQTSEPFVFVVFVTVDAFCAISVVENSAAQIMQQDEYSDRDDDNSVDVDFTHLGVNSPVKKRFVLHVASIRQHAIAENRTLSIET